MRFSTRFLLACTAAVGIVTVHASARGPVTRPAATQDESLPPLEIRPEEQGSISSRLNIDVRDYRFSGNTAFSDRQLLSAPVLTHTQGGQIVVDARVADFRNRQISFDELEQVRVALTLLYVNHGYINSGAVIPEQEARDGIVRIDIVEGRLGEINIHGNKRLRTNYFTDRIRYGSHGAFDINQLRDQLEILRQNPNLDRINAQLHPGDTPGSSYLDVDLQERDTRQLGVSFNNHRSPSVGAERIELFFSQQNLLGCGDALSLRYGLTSGGLHDMRIAGADHFPNWLFPFTNPKDFSVDYTIPISASDTTLTFSVGKTDEVVVEEPFSELNINSETNSYAITLRQPIWRTPRSELALFVTGALRDNRTEVLNEGFAFPPDVGGGKSDVTILRFGQEFVTRDTRQALAIRSTFSVGLNAFNATNDPAADGQFLAWLGQLQYVRKLGQTDAQWVYRLNAQFATDSLLALEQFAVGGVETVRGYRENQLVRDNGITSSLELRVPILSRRPGESILDIAPFVDVGYAYNANGTPSGDLLSSVGLGFLLHPNRHIDGQLYWGHPFKNFENNGRDIQDYGFHFNLTLELF